MADKKLIIADGHHRYETALNYRNQMREQAKSSDPEAPYERVMMSFVNMDTPGLVILPTHRVVFGLEGFNLYTKAMQVMKYFDIEDLGSVKDVPPRCAAAARGRQRPHGAAGGHGQQCVSAEGQARRAIAEPEGPLRSSSARST